MSSNETSQADIENNKTCQSEEQIEATQEVPAEIFQTRDESVVGPMLQDDSEFIDLLNNSIESEESLGKDSKFVVDAGNQSLAQEDEQVHVDTTVKNNLVQYPELNDSVEISFNSFVCKTTFNSANKIDYLKSEIIQDTELQEDIFETNENDSSLEAPAKLLDSFFETSSQYTKTESSAVSSMFNDSSLLNDGM